MKNKMTKQEAIENHRKLWNWLAYHPDKKKQDYPYFENKIRRDCYLCQYVITVRLIGGMPCTAMTDCMHNGYMSMT